MRVSAVLEVLAEQGPVIVVHLPVWGDRSELFDRSWVHRHAAAVLRITDTELPELLQRVQAALTACAPGQPLRLIHAFRLVLAPPALRCLGLAAAARPRLLLDLDDDECARDLEYAALEQAAGRSEGAGRLRAGNEIPPGRGPARGGGVTKLVVSDNSTPPWQLQHDRRV